MKNFKKITAVLTAIAMLASFAACNTDKEPETTTLSVTETSVKAETATVPETAEDTTAEETAVPETTEPETTTEKTETTTEKVETTVVTTTKKETTTKKVTTTKKATTTKKVTTTKKATTTEKKAVAPSSKADIVKLYNDATSKAASSKPGYSKSRTTELNNLNMGMLASIGAVREAVGDFLGEGSSSQTVKKGKFDGEALVKSSLKVSDVKSATCKLSDDGKYYIVEITLNGETNPKKNGSALGRFTKDFKDVDEIKSGLAEVGASVNSMTINTTTVKINARINASNNRFVSLNHTINMKAELNGIKYSFAKVNKATTDLDTKVSYTDFKY